MALIFLLSAQRDLDTGLGLWDAVLRVGAHFTVYALLALALWWALEPVARRAVGVAAAIALLYAISDEYHQSFVPGRSGSPRDVAIDAAGIVAVAALLRYHRRPPPGDAQGTWVPGDE